MLSPWLLVIGMTTRCNAICSYCGRRLFKYPERDIDLDLFKKIVAGVPSGKELQPVEIGEPLMYPHLIEALSFAKKQGLRISLYTNASVLTPELSEQLIFIVDDFRFSVDAADEETYSRMRPGLSFKTMVENIKTFQKLKRARGGITSTSARMTETKDNLNQIDKIKDFWRGITDTVFSIPLEHVPPPSEFLAQPFLTGQGFDCRKPQEHFTVRSDGSLVLCCQDWYGKYPVADLNVEEPMAAYNGEVFNAIRSGIATGKRIPYLCTYCHAPGGRAA